MQSLKELEIQRKELNEGKDCAIVSFALATGTEYKSLAKLSYKLGRKKARRTCWSIVSKLEKKFKMKYVPYKRMQSKNFLKDAEFLKDPIVVSVRGHMFVAKQGKPIWGLWKEKSIVKGYYVKK
jgi:hypothetical protein